MTPSPMLERAIAWVLLAAGLVVALTLAPLDHGLRWFAWNFAFFWAPQALVLAVLLAFRARPAVVAGAALAMALHLVAFNSWVRAHGPGL